jgi:hypothetical protein
MSEGKTFMPSITRDFFVVPPLSVEIVIPTLNPPAALWSFDQAHKRAILIVL